MPKLHYAMPHGHTQRSLPSGALETIPVYVPACGLLAPRVASTTETARVTCARCQRSLKAAETRAAARQPPRA